MLLDVKICQYHPISSLNVYLDSIAPLGMTKKSTSHSPHLGRWCEESISNVTFLDPSDSTKPIGTKPLFNCTDGRWHLPNRTSNFWVPLVDNQNFAKVPVRSMRTQENSMNLEMHFVSRKKTHESWTAWNTPIVGHLTFRVRRILGFWKWHSTWSKHLEH